MLRRAEPPPAVPPSVDVVLVGPPARQLDVRRPETEPPSADAPSPERVQPRPSPQATAGPLSANPPASAAPATAPLAAPAEPQAAAFRSALAARLGCRDLSTLSASARDRCLERLAADRDDVDSLPLAAGAKGEHLDGLAAQADARIARWERMRSRPLPLGPSPGGNLFGPRPLDGDPYE